jgi:hypothetical protein
VWIVGDHGVIGMIMVLIVVVFWDDAVKAEYDAAKD